MPAYALNVVERKIGGHSDATTAIWEIKMIAEIVTNVSNGMKFGYLDLSMMAGLEITTRDYYDEEEVVEKLLQTAVQMGVELKANDITVAQ